MGAPGSGEIGVERRLRAARRVGVLLCGLTQTPCVRLPESRGRPMGRAVWSLRAAVLPESKVFLQLSRALLRRLRLCRPRALHRALRPAIPPAARAATH